MKKRINYKRREEENTKEKNLLDHCEYDSGTVNKITRLAPIEYPQSRVSIQA